MERRQSTEAGDSIEMAMFRRKQICELALRLGSLCHAETLLCLKFVFRLPGQTGHHSVTVWNIADGAWKEWNSE